MVKLSFAVLYGGVSLVSRRHLRENGHLLSHGSTEVVKALQEGLGAIRDVLIDGSQAMYCEVYRKHDLPLRLALGNNVFIGGSPRYIIEALAIALIAALAYLLSNGPEGVASALPVLGALALGAQRMLPAVQQMYISWSSISGSQACLVDTLELLEQPLPEAAMGQHLAPLVFQEKVAFEGVSFRYSHDAPWVLKGLSLSIVKGSRVGFVGSTGSGKSTALDLLLGLLEPVGGQVSIDGVALDSSLKRRAWQQVVAHVPQSIYLADGTVAENIAFGVNAEDIDMDRVRQAAKQANIAEFIEGHKDAYNALVGERGVSLSGGQRQRIGIARALYKKAEVLIFDEATSALDNNTEKKIMETIQNLSRDLTVVIVAHRLSTVKSCDTIFELEQGRLVAKGSYDQLLMVSSSFRELAQAQTASVQGYFEGI